MRAGASLASLFDKRKSWFFLHSSRRSYEHNGISVGEFLCCSIRCVPLLRLREFLGCPEARATISYQHVVATRVDGQMLGLVVDRFIGEQEIVMKPLGNYMGVIRGLAGATILGDGRIGLLIDVEALKDWTPAERCA